MYNGLTAAFSWIHVYDVYNECMDCIRAVACGFMAAVRGGQSFARFFSKFGGARKRKKFREIWALLHEIFSFTSTLYLAQ